MAKVRGRRGSKEGDKFDSIDKEYINWAACSPVVGVSSLQMGHVSRVNWTVEFVVPAILGAPLKN